MMLPTYTIVNPDPTSIAAPTIPYSSLVGWSCRLTAVRVATANMIPNAPNTKYHRSNSKMYRITYPTSTSCTTDRTAPTMMSRVKPTRCQCDKPTAIKISPVASVRSSHESWIMV